MSAFERLLAIADEETLDLARAMIGKPELALLRAKEALKNTAACAKLKAVSIRRASAIFHCYYRRHRSPRLEK
jgi:hypothetical protein